MNTLKLILKMMAGLLIGITIGLAIAGLGIVCFSDISIPEFFSKLISIKLGESIMIAGFGILSCIVSVIIIVIIHEAGHLVFGMLSGYKYVSFRIFSLTIIKVDGKIKIKRFSIAGTGGQCLLSPPDIPLKEIPTACYNFGGVLANIFILLIAGCLFFVADNPFFIEFLVIFVVMGLFLVLINGIPMKISGAGNDGYNMLLLRKNMTSKRSLVYALHTNALIQNGIRPKDMPEEWFCVPENIDYRNQLEVAIPLMAASRHIDEENYKRALAEFEDLYSHRHDIIPLYVKEIACELLFLRLIYGDISGAEELLDNDLRKYIESMRKVMSSKERILCAISLILENDRPKAVEIYDNLLSRQGKYLLQGEVKSDLALIKNMLCL